MFFKGGVTLMMKDEGSSVDLSSFLERLVKTSSRRENAWKM